MPVRLQHVGWRCLAAVALLMAAGASCSGSSPSHKAVPVVRGPGADEILVVYRAWWADYATMTRVFPVDPSNPLLNAHMAGDALAKIEAQLTSMKQRAQYIGGPFVDTSRAAVTGLQPSAASAQDCYLDPSVLLNGNNGKQENQPSKDRSLARIDFSGGPGQWKVTRFTTVHIGCTSAT